jgi:hypothetical protein
MEKDGYIHIRSGRKFAETMGRRNKQHVLEMEITVLALTATAEALKQLPEAEQQQAVQHYYTQQPDSSTATNLITLYDSAASFHSPVLKLKSVFFFNQTSVTKMQREQGGCRAQVPVFEEQARKLRLAIHLFKAMLMLAHKLQDVPGHHLPPEMRQLLEILPPPAARNAADEEDTATRSAVRLLEVEMGELQQL